MDLLIEHLQVELQRQPIIKDLSLSVADGEFTALLGPSGCGKSTLLKTIAGLLPARSGRISAGGRALDDLPSEKRGTVIVFQDLRLFPHMTAAQNIAFSMSLKGIPKKEQKKRVEALLADVQLSGLGDRRIRELSGGQLQRIALARALAAEPEILLLDEPFSGLDEQLKEEMGSLVKRLHKETGLTTILVTHDKNEALRLADRIAIMDRGRILQYAAPEELFLRPADRFCAEYFGKINYLEGRAEQGCFYSPLGSWPAELADGSYTAGIRPWSLHPDGAGFDAVVCDAVFLGEKAEVTLQTQAGSLLCSLASAELFECGWAPGLAVRIGIKPDGILYFAEKE